MHTDVNREADKAIKTNKITDELLKKSIIMKLWYFSYHVDTDTAIYSNTRYMDKNNFDASLWIICKNDQS